MTQTLFDGIPASSHIANGASALIVWSPHNRSSNSLNISRASIPWIGCRSTMNSWVGRRGWFQSLEAGRDGTGLELGDVPLHETPDDELRIEVRGHFASNGHISASARIWQSRITAKRNWSVMQLEWWLNSIKKLYDRDLERKYSRWIWCPENGQLWRSDSPIGW
jgi:hypothetical protein